MADEEYRFVANTAGLRAEMATLNAESRVLQKSMVAAAREAAAGNKEAAVMVRAHAYALAEVDAKYASVTNTLKSLNAEQKAGGGGTGVANIGREVAGAIAPMTAFNRLAAQKQQVIAQLSFAMDDAITVFGTSGWAGAARAAGNNLSYVLSIVNPMLAVVPALGAAIGTMLIPRLFGTADAATKTKDSLKETSDTIDKLIEDTERLAHTEQERDDAMFIRDQQKSRGEEEGKLQKASAARQAAEAAKRAVDDPTTTSWRKTWEVLRSPFGNDVNKDLAEARATEDAARRRLAQLDETIQKRGAATERKAAEKEADRVVRRFDAPLKEMAQAAIATGEKPENVRVVVEAGIRAQLSGRSRDFAGEQARRIVDEADEAAAVEGFRRRGEALSAAEPFERQRRAIQSRLLRIQADRADAEAASPRGRLRPADERRFDKETAPLEAELKRLTAAIADAKNRDEEAKDRKQLRDIMDDIRKFFRGNPDVPPPPRQPVL